MVEKNAADLYSMYTAARIAGYSQVHKFLLIPGFRVAVELDMHLLTRREARMCDIVSIEKRSSCEHSLSIERGLELPGMLRAWIVIGRGRGQTECG